MRIFKYILIYLVLLFFVPVFVPLLPKFWQIVFSLSCLTVAFICIIIEFNKTYRRRHALPDQDSV